MLLRICLIVAQLPWKFGPYQQQMYLLSHQLANKGHDILWMPYNLQFNEQLYSSEQIPAPSTFNHSFITYAGFQGSYIRTSTMNRLAQQYEVDAYITLTDVEKIIRDDNLIIPSIAWHPHHFNTRTPLDSYILHGFTAVASLAPGKQHFIPHIVEPVEPTIQLPRDKNIFMVLLQGGNYEEFDRKGWEISLQAFSEFQKQVPNSHLYIHSVSKVAIMENNRNQKAPWNVQNPGQPLRYLLHLLNITNYTLDEQIHSAEHISTLKQSADVCLHPSRVEGFGMNVLECQYFGTPVITTNFTAMSAFTHFGHAIPPLQLSYYLRGFLAVPDISGVTKALHDIYNGVWKGSASSAKEWILNDFSAIQVGRAFHRLLQNKTLVKFDSGIRRVITEYMDIIGINENRQWTMFGNIDTAVTAVSNDSDVIRIHKKGAIVAIMVKNWALLNIQIQTVWVPKLLNTIMATPHVTVTDMHI